MDNRINDLSLSERQSVRGGDSWEWVAMYTVALAGGVLSAPVLLVAAAGAGILFAYYEP